MATFFAVVLIFGGYSFGMGILHRIGWCILGIRLLGTCYLPAPLFWVYGSAGTMAMVSSRNYLPITNQRVAGRCLVQ